MQNPLGAGNHKEETKRLKKKVDDDDDDLTGWNK